MRLIFLLIYNLIRVCLFKIYYRTRFVTNMIQRISPCCALKLYGHGRMVIGRNCQFEAGCDLQVHGDGELRIGQRVYMNRYCMVSAHGVVEIGDNTIFGPGVRVFDNNHRFDNEHGALSQLSIGSIKIGKNCWIGANAILLKGANIGDNCVIGAGCVVKDVVPDCSLVRLQYNNTIETIRS